MIGMTPEKFLDALPVDAKLFFNRKEDVDQRERQLAFGIGRGRAAAELGSMSKQLHPSRATVGTPQTTAVQEFFPLSFAGFFQSLGCWEALYKHPRTD